MIKTHRFLCNTYTLFVHVDALDTLLFIANYQISELVAVLRRFEWITLIQTKEI